MKKVLILSTILFFAFQSSAQLFTIDYSPIFRQADSSVLKLALAGGLNQPQFSNIDLNGDGKLDLFVFDRSGNKPLCFIAEVNNGVVSYFYDPQYEELFPLAREFMFLHDYNGDGLPDIWSYGYLENKVQLYKNTSTSIPNFTYTQNLRAYNFDNPPFDTSDFVQFKGNFPDIVDMDGDGDLDYVSNIAYCGSNITYYKSVNEEFNIGYNKLDFEIPDYCLGNVGEDGITVVLNKKCDYQRNYRSKKHCGVKTLGFFDNDNDGDMDLFFGTSEQPSDPIYFLENGKSDLGMAIDTFIRLDSAYFPQAVESLIPVAPASSFVDVDLDGELDLILSTNELLTGDYPVMQTNNVLYFKNNGTTTNPDFQFQRNDFLNGDMIDFGAHTAPTFVDLDGDMDLDLIIGTNGDDYITGDTTYHLVYFENIGSQTQADFILRDANYLDIKQYKLKFLHPCFADVDGDNDPDLFIGKLDGTINFYENTGSSTSPAFTLSSTNYLNTSIGELSAPYFYDIDNNGTLDLFIGEYDGNINYYQNQGTSNNPSFVYVTDSFGGMLTNELIPQTIIDPNRGVIDTMVFNYFGNSTMGIGKLNNDSMAFITGGSDGKLRIFIIPSDLNSQFEQDSSQTYNNFTQSIYIKDWGALAVPAVGDLDNDGYADVLVGNNRGGVHYLNGRNTVSVNSKKLEIKRFRIHPNPSSGVLNISLDNNLEFAYKILDVNGRIVQEEPRQVGSLIQLSPELSNGLYFLQLSTKDSNYSIEKFVILR